MKKQSKEKKKPITVRLAEEDIATVKDLGGITKGIRKVINDYRGVATKEEKKTIENQFYDMIIMPMSASTRETYKTFIEIYISDSGERFHTNEKQHKDYLNYFEPKISGNTGYDATTTRKHLRSMCITRFVKASGKSFRPVLRLKDEIKEEDFMLVYNNFVNFIRSKGRYEDIGKKLWDKKEEK